MSEPNRIDGDTSKGYLYEVTSTDLVQAKTKKRMDDTYKGQQQAKRNERRWNITFAICALVLGLCALAAQIYGAWKR